MSTLKVDTVRNNASGFNNVVAFADADGTVNGQLCRAWVNFNGTGTVAIRNDFNVNTIDDNGNGQYTINFDNAMTDANYSLQATADGVFNGTTCNIGHGDADNSGLSASSAKVESRGSEGSGSNLDATIYCVSVFR